MKKTIVLTCAACLLMSGCTSILKSDEPVATIFSLRPSAGLEPLENSRSSLSHVLEIQRPALPPGFDTARIGMYLENGRRLDYYAGGKWPSPLDETLQEFTGQTARKLLGNAIVTAPGQSLEPDYRLQIRVNDFEPIYQTAADRPPMLIASFSFTLLHMPDEKIVTSFTLEQQAMAQNNSLSSVTAGLEDLLQSVEGTAFSTIAGHMK